MRRLSILAAAMLLLALATSPLIAEDTETTGGEGGFARHDLGLLAGATTGDGETGFTLGADYEYRPLNYLGLGIAAEYVSSLDAREWAVVLPVVSHPNREPQGGWKLIIGPGLEIRESGNDFLVRLGITYGYPMNGWTLSPVLNADLVHGEWSFVYGIRLGMGL